MPASPSSLVVTILGPTSVQLTWNDGSGPNLRFIQVFYNNISSIGSASFVRGVRAGVSKLLIQGLTPFTTYYFWLRAQDNSDAISTALGPVSATTSQRAYSNISGKEFLAKDIVTHLAAAVPGFQVGGTTPNFPLFAEPVFQSGNPDKAAVISLTEDGSINHHHRVYTAKLKMLFRSPVQSEASSAAEAIRNYFQPSGGRIDVTLPSGRRILASQNTSRKELVSDSAVPPRFQVQVSTELQLQGNEVNISGFFV